MNAFLKHKFQQTFFDELELQFPKRGAMITAISEQLNVGRDAVYRRLRGDTILSADELMILAKKYGISLDQGHADSRKLQRTYPSSNWKVKSELVYYRQVEEWSTMILELPEVSVDFATSELPVFYEFSKRNLFAFKIYIYAQTCWGLDKWKGKEFRPELIDPEVFKIAARLTNNLFKLPGREMWSVGILDVTLRQIEHSVDVGTVRSLEIIDDLFTELEEIIVHMEATTNAGKRFPPGETYTEDSPNLVVYNNELMDNSNAILFKSRDVSLAYTALVNPSYLLSKEEEVIGQIERWIDNMIETSNVINSQSGQYGNRFFARLRRQVAASRRRVDDLLLLL